MSYFIVDIAHPNFQAYDDLMKAFLERNKVQMMISLDMFHHLKFSKTDYTREVLSSLHNLL